MSLNLNPTKALIFRIVHVDNIPWILRNGVHCQTSPMQDPGYVSIGNAELIDRRSRRVVRIGPGGNLSDYVPFYFTPWSIMLYKIHTGHGGIPKRENREIVFLVSSLPALAERGVPFLFTNQHAYTIDAEYFDDLAALSRIDWDLLQARDFKTDPADPGKQARYQAEALVFRHVPLDALLGLVCYTDVVKTELQAVLDDAGVSLRVDVLPKWYF